MRPSPGRIWGRRLLALAAVVVVIAAAFLFWLRNSSLFEVRDVEVTGATTNAVEVKAALDRAAVEMTTLHVSEDKLLDAVRRFPTVGSLTVDAQPPHKLKIEVTERLPVATVHAGNEEVPVSADGYLLRGISVDQGLPSIDASARPSRDRLAEADVEQSELLGAAPQELRDGIQSSRLDPENGGVTVDLDNGIELRLGDSSDAGRKWAAAAAVLADPHLGSPSYIDVSVPERPVTGGG